MRIASIYEKKENFSSLSNKNTWCIGVKRCDSFVNFHIFHYSKWTDCTITEPRFGGVLCYAYQKGVNMPKGIGYPKGMKKPKKKGKKKKK